VFDTGPAKVASAVPGNGNKADRAQDILAGALLLEELKNKSLTDAVAVTGHAILSETQIAYQNIAAFDVEGEKRCCLPQILNGVLAQISLPTIHAACDELQLSVSTCTPEQLEVLGMILAFFNTSNCSGVQVETDSCNSSQAACMVGKLIWAKTPFKICGKQHLFSPSTSKAAMF
jgi:hypothetical protein